MCLYLMRIITQITLLILSFTAKAQLLEPGTLNSTGGNFVFRGTPTTPNFSLVWSVGESTLIKTFSVNGGMYFLTQGVLQPFVPLDLQTIPVQGWNKEEVKYYPNPVSTLLQFDLFSNDTGRVVLRVIDLLGNTHGVREFQYNTLPVNQKIDFSKYASGPYYLMLSLYSKGHLKKHGVFKILKLR
jgi:Secretion system C-terminal sorting domain